MTSIVEWAIWAAVMVLVMGGLSRAWKKETAAFSEGELRHPKVILIVALATGVPFFAAGVAALIFAEGERWVALVFFGCSLLGAYLLWEYLKVRYALSLDGFRYRTLFAGAGEERWSEVTAVRWSQASKWFRLELRDGRVVRISVLILGLERFAGAALSGVNTEAIDPGTRQILELCARGQAPSPWG